MRRFSSLLFVVVVVCTVCSGIPALAVDPTDRTITVSVTPPQREVTVSAMNEINVVPDEVVLSLSVSTEDNDDLMPAKIENDNRTRKVLGAIQVHGIADKDVRIDCLAMHRRYDHQTRQVIGYAVDRKIAVTLGDFDALEPMIADALKGGATSIDDILFRTKKHREHQVETRRLAVLYAKEKASHLAELNGLALGKAVNISESVEGDEHTRGGGFGMGGAMGSAGVTREKSKSFFVNVRHLVQAAVLYC